MFVTLYFISRKCSLKSRDKHVKTTMKVIKRHIASSRHRVMVENNRDKVKIAETNLATDLARIKTEITSIPI